MIEHFSKWLELLLLPDRSNDRITYVFLDKMFSRLGALVEVIINQGMNICGDFQKLCEKTLIDHQTLHETILRQMV
jgi:hypothetical protein